LRFDGLSARLGATGIDVMPYRYHYDADRVISVGAILLSVFIFWFVVGLIIYFVWSR
jgi:hypothetical protein